MSVLQSGCKHPERCIIGHPFNPPHMTTELKQTIIKGVMEEAGNRSVDELAQEEHEMLLGLLNLRAKSTGAPKKGG
jgi:hypothetical protein